MAVSTTASLNDLFADLYEDAIHVARETNLMAGLVTNLTARGMAARHMGIWAQSTAQVVAEGQDYSNSPEFAKTLLADVTPAIVKVQHIVTDSQIQTDQDDTMSAAADEMGGAIGTKIDVDLLARFSGFTTDKGTAGSALTIARCAAGMSVLQNRKVRAPFYFVLHPYGWYDIWTELGQPATNKAFLGEAANEALLNFYVGDWMGAMWFTSSNISVDGSDDAVSGLFVREAIVLDTRQTPTLEVERDASIAGGGWELNMEAWYGTGVRRDTYGVMLTHDATEPTGV